MVRTLSFLAVFLLASAAAAAPPATPVEPIASYPWAPTSSDDRLSERFDTPPAGFTRVDLPEGSFGRFLRGLPLQKAGSPIIDYAGNLLHQNGQHPDIVAVADIDIGAKNLQHCADVIIRLHGEWRYGKGARDLAYKSVSGQLLSYPNYVAGDRAIVEGKGIVMKRVALAQPESHAVMRKWMDEVFSWAGTASLEAYSKKVAWSDVTPGDFFVMSGSPYGHAVLILDMAKDANGKVALLLGQSYMPAQSFQVLKGQGQKSAWFIVGQEDTAVDTPFWAPFPKTSLRRM